MLRPNWIFCSFLAVAALGGLRAIAQSGLPAASSEPASTQVTTSQAANAKVFEENLSLIKGNNTPEARKLGAERLLETGSEDALSRLIDILNNPTPDLPAQLAVCQAIAASEKPPASLVEPLLSLLGDGRPGLVEGVAQAIRRFESSLVVGKLRPIAQAQGGPRARRLAAIRALGQLGDEIQAIGVLAGLFKDEDRAVRNAAFIAFSEATGVADPQAASEWYESRKSKSGMDWLKSIVDARSQQVLRLKAEKSELSRRLVAAYREADRKSVV